MAGSVNKVILVGNLGRDPEIRNTQDGMKVVNLSVATGRDLTITPKFGGDGRGATRAGGMWMSRKSRRFCCDAGRSF